MEANNLPPPGQTVPPVPAQASSSLDDTATNLPVSSYSGAPKNYPIESLEVHQEGQARPVVSYAPTSLSVPFSRRKATIVSLIITLAVILITGAIAAFFVRRSSNIPASQIDLPTQDASLESAIESDLPLELQGLENTLLVNGDVVTRGQLRVVSGSFTSSIAAANLTENQTVTLPNVSGEVCLNANNCNFATQAQLAQIQPVASVTALNDLAGAVTVQGSFNQIAVTTGDGVIVLSTPQNLDANANVQFGSLTLNGLGSTSGVLVATGTSAITSVTAGGAGLCLVSTGGAPAFQACPGGGGAVSSLNSLTGALTLQGTANQINVASGGTTITLSTPQDIATTSNVTFNGLTVTTNADVNGTLAVGSNAVLAPTTNALVVNHDITGDCSFGCSGISVTTEGTVPATWMWGVISGVNMTSGGTFNAAGLYAKSAVVSGTGAIGSNYGLYVALQTVGTNDYGIYVEGADTYALWIDSGISRFDGNLEFEGTTDDAFETTLTVANPTGIDKTITLPDETGTVCLRNSTLCGFATGSGTGFLQGGNNFGGATAGTLGTINGGDLNLITNNLTRLVVQADGDVAFDADTFFVDAIDNQVGVGTATPGTRLHVKQSAQGIAQGTRVENSSNANAINLFYGSGGAPALDMQGDFQIGHTTFGGYTPSLSGTLTAGRILTLQSLNNSSAGGIVFDLNGVELGRFHNNGNFGIGDATPLYALTVGNGDLFGVNSSGNVIVTALGAASTDTVVCRNASNQLATCNSTFATGSGAAFLQGGNDFGGTTVGTLGTANNGDLNVISNNLTRLTVQADGDLAVDTNTLFVDAANNRVGIGTITPGTVGEAVTLEVDGNIGIMDDHQLTFSSNASKFWSLNTQEANNKFVLSNQGNGIVAFNSVGWLRNSPFGPSGFPDAEIHTGGSTVALNAWGTNGLQVRVDPGTYTDDSTAAAGTATDTVFNSFAVPLWSATNANVTTTNAATVYVQGAPALAGGSDDAITNAYSLWIDDGTSRFDGSVLLANGTAGSPEVSFTGDPNTGLYWVAADQLGFSTGGANQVTIGVDPAAAPFATGTVRIQTNDINTTDDFEIFGAGNQDLDIGSDRGMSLNINQVSSGGIFSIFSGGDELLTINSDGNIDTRGGSVTFLQGFLRLGVDAFSIADGQEIIPGSSFLEVTCTTGGGCTLTMDEDFSSRGQTVRIVNVGAEPITINNTSGNVELAGSAAWAGSQWSSLSLLYVAADGAAGRWVELARSVH